MTVKELIEELQKFPEDMEVLLADYETVEEVFEGTWTHTNYPYNKPDRQVVCLR